ncbi:MAG: tetratricopeptide repeat protein [Candidatus Riflebacteria bacterium]|nr:tetratricopeptide repeat protein [Candidatus Riflebacteria bacterium]
MKKILLALTLISIALPAAFAATVRGEVGYDSPLERNFVLRVYKPSIESKTSMLMGVKEPISKVTVHYQFTNTAFLPKLMEPLDNFTLYGLSNTPYKPMPDAERAFYGRNYNLKPGMLFEDNVVFEVKTSDLPLKKIAYTYGRDEVVFYFSEDTETSYGRTSNSKDALIANIKSNVVDADFGEASNLFNTQGLSFNSQNFYNLLYAYIEISRNQTPGIGDERFLDSVNYRDFDSAAEMDLYTLTLMKLSKDYDALLALSAPDLSFSLDERLEKRLGQLYYLNGNLERSAEILRVYENSSDPTVSFYLGNIADKKDKPEEAITQWKKTVELDPFFSEAYFNIAVLLFRQGETDGAADYFMRTLNSNPPETLKYEVKRILDRMGY